MLKLQECPAGSFSDDFVVVVRQLLEYGQEFLPAAIADCDYSVAAEARSLGPTNRGAMKDLPEFLFGNPRKPVQSGIDQARPGVEFKSGGDWSFAVPRADVLANVAAKKVGSHARA